MAELVITGPADDQTGEQPQVQVVVADKELLEAIERARQERQ